MRALLLLLFTIPALAAGFRAGVAKVDITPAGPIWMSGYAARTHPSEGVLVRLYAKALALDDGKNGRAVIVTTDLVGIPRGVSEIVAARALKEHKLERSQLVLNSSHTHTGPVVTPNLVSMWNLPPAEETKLNQYSTDLTDKLVTLIGAALSDLQPAQVNYGTGEADFAANRREFTPNGVKIGVNPKGPIDHSVPVLRVTSADGKLRAILFGYACHNTTLGGDIYQLTGDYAGYAQRQLEKDHPGATALFFMLCGADQNPAPRGTISLAEQHGRALAAAVDATLKSRLTPIHGPIRSAFITTDLAFAPHTRATFEAMKDDKIVARAKLATNMLRAYDEGHPVRKVVYPVQAIRFAKDLTMLILGGEVVVGYDLRAKQTYPKENLIVAGYSNDVMCYIPTRKIIQEGGYEAVDSMAYYGQPGPFTETVEETIFDAIGHVMRRVGVK